MAGIVRDLFVAAHRAVVMAVSKPFHEVKSTCARRSWKTRFQRGRHRPRRLLHKELPPISCPRLKAPHRGSAPVRHACSHNLAKVHASHGCRIGRDELRVPVQPFAGGRLVQTAETRAPTAVTDGSQ